MSNIILYKNLIVKYKDLNHNKVISFKNKHKYDDEFLKRAEILEKLFILKKELE